MHTAAGIPPSVKETLSIEDALNILSMQNNDITLYRAGLPHFPSNFTRDSILASILLSDAKMLRDQLTYCALLQGKEKKAQTGEEPGKIFHEMPGVRIEGLNTEFNACDTTALFVYGHEVYLTLTHDEEFITRQRKYLEKAVEYILSHVVNNLFVEDPKYCGAKRFALRVTYWKDSQVPDREEGLPIYPAVFTLAHVQNLRALRSAAHLLQAPDLAKKADAMVKYMSVLYDEKRGLFHIGIDQRGFLPGVSSDNVHMLYYLNKGDITEGKVQSIITNTGILETDYGYLTVTTQDPWLSQDITIHTGYHTNTIWPFEQAFIHQGALKFDLPHVLEVSGRISAHLDTYPEIISFAGGRFKKGGDILQLWTVAAKSYFDKIKKG